MTEEVIIAGAYRTAIGRLSGTLAGMSGVEMGSALIRQSLARLDLAPDAVDSVILGQVLTAGAGQNPARQSTIRAGLAQSVPAVTVNQVCGSGLAAIMMAAREVARGESRAAVVPMGTGHAGAALKGAARRKWQAACASLASAAAAPSPA